MSAIPPFTFGQSGFGDASFGGAPIPSGALVGGAPGLNIQSQLFTTLPQILASPTVVDFVPSTTSAFTFQPTLNGTEYTAVVTWNVFGQRYYLNLYDASGTLIVCRSLTSSGPSLAAVFTWSMGVVTAVTTNPHNVPVGTVVDFFGAQTDSPFDGYWQGLSVNSNAINYSLPANPNEPIPLNGVLSFPLNLVAGFDLGFLLFHYDTQQFEF